MGSCCITHPTWNITTIRTDDGEAHHTGPNKAKVFDGYKKICLSHSSCLCRNHHCSDQSTNSHHASCQQTTALPFVLSEMKSQDGGLMLVSAAWHKCFSFCTAKACLICWYTALCGRCLVCWWMWRWLDQNTWVHHIWVQDRWCPSEYRWGHCSPTSPLGFEVRQRN